MALDAGWTRTIDAGITNSMAHIYDGVVYGEWGSYYARLMVTPGFVVPIPTLLIAMLWVESGGPMRSEWFSRVMQIGNAGDKGWPALQRHEGTTVLVVRPELLRVIDAPWSTTLLNTPVFSIQAGLAYLFMKMSLSDDRTILDPQDTTLHQHSVEAGETASSIAHSESTTVEELQASNPGINLDRLRPGQTLRCHRARRGRVITGWRSFNAETIASNYNGTGDPNYAEKLRYVHRKLTGG